MNGYLNDEELDEIKERNDEASWVTPIDENQGLRAMIDRDELLIHVDSLATSIAAQALRDAADALHIESQAGEARAQAFLRERADELETS